MTTLRNLLNVGKIAGTIALTSLFPIKNSEAQASGNVEYIQSEQPDKSFARANIFYTAPFGANGFSFIEFYRNGKGYFGKTILNRRIGLGLGAKLEAIHVGEPLSKVGLGASFSVPKLPEGSFANLELVPLWISEEERRMQVQYVFGFSLPEGFNLSGFGELNLLAENGPQWGYGETKLTKRLGPAELGYNMRLRNDGDASPKIEHGVIATLNFRGRK